MDIRKLLEKAKGFQAYLPGIMLWYILNKNLFDWMTFGVSKACYYLLIFAGAAMGALAMLRNPRLRAVVYAFGVYCVVIVLNGLFLSNFDQLKEGIKTYLTFPLPLFALWYFLRQKKNHVRLLKSMVLWGCITSVLGIYEYFAMHSVLPGFEGRIYTFANGSSAYRATVFVGSPLMLAVLLGASLILCVFFLHREKKLLYAPAAAVILAGLLCTASRAPLVLTVLGIGVMYLQFLRQGTLSKKLVYGMLIAVGCVVLVLTIFIIFPELSTGNETLDFMIYRLTSTFDFSGEWGNSGRMKIWKHYIGEFVKRPVFGYGIATTSAEVASNRLICFGGFWQIVTESGVLARLVETGILGTAAYYVFVLLCVKSILFPSLPRPRRVARNSLLFALTGVLVLLFAENIVLQITLDIYCMFLLCFTAAYGMNMRYPNTGKQTAPEFYYARRWVRKLRRILANNSYGHLIEKNADCRILVILHLYYQQSWKEIKEYLKNLDAYNYDLIVTVTEGKTNPRVLADVESFPHTKKIIPCENRGYDLGPFLRVLEETNLDSYDIVFKLQSKSTKRPWIYIYRQLFFRRDWFLNLYEGILSAKNAHLTVDALYTDEKVGMVAAWNLIVSDPKHKQQLIVRQSASRGLSIREDYRFVAGTCFAVRAQCLKPVQQLRIMAEDFQSTAAARGLSFGHFLERYLCATVQDQGYALAGNTACTVRRALKRPLEALLGRFSSERLHEEDILIDPEFFLWQLDNKLITFRYEQICVGSLVYSHNGQRYPFTKGAPYRYLKGDKEGYRRYCEYHEKAGLPQMSMERFDALRDSIVKNGYDPRHIILVGDGNVIMDGQHRACCICHTFGRKKEIRVLHIREISIKAFIKRILPQKLVCYIQKSRQGEMNRK